MTKLTYSREELLREHDYSAEHVVSGRRMHGGMSAEGNYQPPRSLGRVAALDAWTEALRAHGGEMFDAHSSLLDGDRTPTVLQSQVLLRHGLSETFWNSLTITGKIEARGRLLADVAFPDLQPYTVEDISKMAIGHLNRGLLYAHGIDEGGQPDIGIGGHDEMWFVARDLAFGPEAHPDVEPPDNISRPEAGQRFMPEVPQAVEGLLSLLMNLLIIEFRAEIGWAATQAVLRTPDLFADRRAEAELAAEIVGRIRTDEEIHVSSLQLYLGELCTVRFRTETGGEIAGADLINRFWGELVTWATTEQPRQQSQAQRVLIEQRIRLAADAERILAAFDAAA